jgi:hypothetical protein
VHNVKYTPRDNGLLKERAPGVKRPFPEDEALARVKDPKRGMNLRAECQGRLLIIHLHLN